MRDRQTEGEGGVITHILDVLTERKRKKEKKKNDLDRGKIYANGET